MKNRLYLILLPIVVMAIIPTHISSYQPDSFKKGVEQWADKYPTLYSAAYFSSVGLLSVAAGALYARYFKPELLTAKDCPCEPHVFGAMATVAATGLASYFAPCFFNQVRETLPENSLRNGGLAAAGFLFLIAVANRVCN
jgi:hypothetical protein